MLTHGSQNFLIRVATLPEEMQTTFEIPCQEASVASWLAMPDGPVTTTQGQ